MKLYMMLFYINQCESVMHVKDGCKGGGGRGLKKSNGMIGL